MSLRILSDGLPAKGCLQCNAYRSQFSLSMLALFFWDLNPEMHDANEVGPLPLNGLTVMQVTIHCCMSPRI